MPGREGCVGTEIEAPVWLLLPGWLESTSFTMDGEYSRVQCGPHAWPHCCWLGAVPSSDSCPEGGVAQLSS